MELITEPPSIMEDSTIPRWNGNMISSPRNPREHLNTNKRINSPSPVTHNRNEIPTIGNIRNIGNIERTPLNLGSRVEIHLTPIKLEETTSIPKFNTPVAKTVTPAPKPIPTPVPTPTPTPKIASPVKPVSTPVPEPKIQKPKQAPKKKVYVRPSQRPIPDYSTYSDIDKAKQWAVLDDRFARLKQSLPDDYPIRMPDPEKETLEECHARYNQLIENYQKNKFINDEMDKYRFYLICFWAVIEVVLLLFGVTSANGYTNLQLMMASQYDFTLMELGEQTWEEMGGSSSSSPIYDILSSSVFTMVIFVILKCVTSFLGEEMSNKSTNYIMGKMLENRKAKEGSSLFGIGDIFNLIGDLKNMTGQGEGGNNGVLNLITKLMGA